MRRCFVSLTKVRPQWQEAGVWEELQRVLLDRLRSADRLDFSRVAVDSSHVPAKRGRSHPKVGPSPVTEPGRAQRTKC
jgi:transposase